MTDLELLYLASKIRIIVLRNEKDSIIKRLGVLNKKELKYRANIELCIQKLGIDRMKELKTIIEDAERKYKIK